MSKIIESIEYFPAGYCTSYAGLLFKGVKNRKMIFLRHLNWRPQTVKSITKFRLNIIVIASIIEQIALIPVLDKEHSCRGKVIFLFLTPLKSKPA